MEGLRRHGATIAWGLLGLSVLMRCLHLDWLPGVNGDEAWYGAQAQRLWAGEGFDWLTPTGNPQNPIFMPLFVLAGAAPPSVVALRLPSLLLGVAAIVASHRLLRSTFDDGDLARSGALLVAALPVFIGYSRFSWDTSATPLVSIVALGLALQGHALAAAVAFVALAWVHSANVFCAFPLVGAAIGALASEADPPRRRRLLWLGTGLATSALLGLGALHLIATYLTGAEGGHTGRPAGPLAFLLGYGRLLSGATLHAFVAAPLPAASLRVHDVAIWTLILVTLAAGLWRQRRLREERTLGLAAGTVVGVAAFGAVVGVQGVTPGLERYAMALPAPALLSLLLLHRGTRWLGAATMALAALLLVSFWAGYFAPRLSARGDAHRAFAAWDGREPKVEALSRVLGDANTQGPVHVVAEDWWLHQPLAYFGYGERRARVESAIGRMTSAELSALRAGGAYLVGFADGPMARELSPENGHELPPVPDARGRPFIRIWAPTGTSAHR